MNEWIVIDANSSVTLVVVVYAFRIYASFFLIAIIAIILLMFLSDCKDISLFYIEQFWSCVGHFQIKSMV